MRPAELEIKTSGSKLQLFFSATASGEDCHACPGRIGLILYKQKGESFVFEGDNGEGVEMGSWGIAPTPDNVSVMAINEKGEFAWRVDESYGNHGKIESTSVIFASISGSVDKIGKIQIGSSNSGACGPEVAEKCTELNGLLALDPEGAESEYQSLILHIFGSMKEQPFYQRVRYSFDVKKQDYSTIDYLPEEFLAVP
ncbi:hypothetical protein [Aestuariivirga sp.]|jgi:hypothetical protein|uniref:hypothetical protein n=1 Tax=Aestuariivirga sp. TaxID=2650926 RepID=UPI0037850FBB